MSKRITEEFQDPDIYPASQSASGTNAYYHTCSVLECQAAYASCLAHIADHKVKKLSSLFDRCGTALRQGICPAVDMQTQEQAAGKAMFYLNRAKMREFYKDENESEREPSQPGYQPPTRRVSTGRTAAPVSMPVNVPVPAAPQQPSDNIYADAINAAVKPTVFPRAPATMNHSAVTKGMSPLALARLQMNKGVVN